MKKHVKEQIEDKTLNQPAAKYFKKKMKCSFVETEFRYAGVRLDVLAYNSDEKCFYICEGKNAKSIAGLGHAIGQLISYMSLIQEDGFNFLEIINDSHRVNLRDIDTFYHSGNIKARFYVILPYEQIDKMERSSEIVKKNIGEFSKYIGICYASEKKFIIKNNPLVKEIDISRKYNRDKMLREMASRISEDKNIGKSCDEVKTDFKQLIQFKKKNGNSNLHYEIWFKDTKKTDRQRTIEVAFHIEFSLPSMKSTTTVQRKNKLMKAMKEAKKKIQREDDTIKYQEKWGKNWTKLYFEIYVGKKHEYRENDIELILQKLRLLFKYLHPELEKVKWGRMHEYTENEGESDYGK